MLRTSLACLALSSSVLVTESAAQGPGALGKGVLGRDNPDFARQLFDEGYIDLAERLCRTIEENNAPANELLEVKALGFELRLKRVLDERDFAKRKEGLLQLIQDEKAFIDENSRTRVADFVRTNLPRVYLELATTLTAALTVEKDVARRAELTQEGQRVFEDAKTTLRDRVERFTAQLDTGTGNLEYAERQLETARFNLARMDYQHSLLFAQGSPERKELVESSLEGFRAFGFDYPESLLNYQGIIYQGLCHESLGLPEDALIDYEDVVALRAEYPFEKDQFQVGGADADVISGATLRRVKLLTKLKRAREASSVAEDFLRTIPDALFTNSGPDVVAAKAEAEIAAGDVAAASSTAQILVDADPQGRWGAVGRSLLSRLPVSNLAPDKILRIAETTALRGDFSLALDLCRRAREVVRGARDEPELGAASFLLAGTIYRWQGRLHEASLAFDLAAELYPRSSRAPEALNSAVSVYSDLARRDKSRFYNKRADERMNALATRYPQHPLAANAGIWQGRKLEVDGDFAGAIEFYSKIDPGSATYHEAALRMASATYSQAKALQGQKKNDEARPFLGKGEELYRKAIEQLTKGQEETLDAAVQQKLGLFLFQARVELGQLLIELGKAAQVLPLIEGLENKVQNDADKVSAVWSLRITALQAEGKLDQAQTLFESLRQSSPSSPSVATAAGVLARALDRAAAAQPKGSKHAEELWTKAADYYRLSVDSALDGTAVLRAEEVSVVAQRLYVLGLFFNNVPEFQSSFVDWQGEVVSPELWQEAARIYERLDAQAPSYRIAIERARTLGLLGRIAEAEELYARLFDQYSLFDPDSKSGRFDPAAVDARPELVSAYLEYAVATHLVGLEGNNAGKLDRARDIYRQMLDNTKEDQRLWWQAKFFQLRLLSDRGDYEQADLGLRNVKRTNPKWDEGKFGFQEKFTALEAELAKKVFNRPKPR